MQISYTRLRSIHGDEPEERRHETTRPPARDGTHPAGPAAASRSPSLVLPTLMLSVFTISVGFGILLPRLPALIEGLLGPGSSPAAVSRATGLLTALYMLALFLCAPLWGRLSDRCGRRPVLLIGLGGFGATMIAFAVWGSFGAVIAERALSGVFAAAIMPVALAAVTDIAAAKALLGRRLSFVSLAGISGFLLGPTIGLALAGRLAGATGPLVVPLVATGGLALVAAVAVALALPAGSEAARARPGRTESPLTPGLVTRLLTLGTVVTAGVAVFEVGLALRGAQDLGLTAFQIAAMFTVCSLVMIAVQAAIFSPLLRPEATRWLIAPAFAVLAAGMVLVPMAGSFAPMLAVIGAVAASAGILSPILTYWIASHAGHASGAELGRQTAAASLGAAAGSAAGGLLYDVAWLPNASFVLMGALTALAVVASLRLPRMLAPSGEAPAATPRRGGT
jgi:MFS family permease